MAFRASASSTQTASWGSESISRTKVRVSVLSPRPLPITTTSAQRTSSARSAACAGPRVFPSSFRVMRSGDMALMAQATFSGAATLTRSAPERRAAMATRKGAPAYSWEPPMTSTFPFCPLCESGARLGKTTSRLVRTFILSTLEQRYLKTSLPHHPHGGPLQRGQETERLQTRPAHAGGPQSLAHEFRLRAPGEKGVLLGARAPHPAEPPGARAARQLQEALLAVRHGPHQGTRLVGGAAPQGARRRESLAGEQRGGRGESRVRRDRPAHQPLGRGTGAAAHRGARRPERGSLPSARRRPHRL